MTQYSDEEKQEVQGSSSPSTTAGPASKAASSTSPAQLPIWTQSPGTRSPFAPGGILDPNLMRKTMEEAGKPIREWLDQHIDEFRTQLLPLPAIMQRVLDNVPAADKLPGDWVASTIRNWAMMHGINLLDPSQVWGKGEDAGSSTNLPMTESDLAASLKRLLNIPTDITVDRKHGKAVISSTGATIELRSRAGLKLGGSVEWNGKMGLSAAYGNISLQGSLTAQQWNLNLSYTLGPSVPDLGSLAKVFQDGVRSFQETVSDIDKTGGKPSAVKDIVSSHWDKVDKAVKTASQIAKMKSGQLSISGQIGAKGPTFGSGPQSPTGVEAKIVITWTF